MKKIIFILITASLLNGCSISDFTKPIGNLFSSGAEIISKQNPEGAKSLINVSTVENSGSKSFFANNDNSDEQAKILKETIVVNATAIPIKDLLEKILPNWSVRLPNVFDDVMIDAVIQTTRKQAVFDVLSQLRAQANFYTKTQPKPILVVYEN